MSPADRTQKSCKLHLRKQKLCTGRTVQEEVSVKETRRKSRRRVALDQRRYEIGDLVDAGIDPQGNELYRVRWSGYSPEEDTWEPAENLPRALIREYKRIHAL